MSSITHSLTCAWILSEKCPFDTWGTWCKHWQVLSVNVLFQSGVYTQSREDENSLPCIFPVWLDRSSSLRSVLNLNLTVTQEASHCLPVLWILKTFSTCKPKTSLSREREKDEPFLGDQAKCDQVYTSSEWFTHCWQPSSWTSREDKIKATFLGSDQWPMQTCMKKPSSILKVTSNVK